MPDAITDALKQDVALREAEVRESWTLLVEEEENYARTFLLEQLRLTITEQNEVTQKLNIRAFLAEAKALCGLIAKDLQEYLRSIPESSFLERNVLSGAPRREELSRVARRFGDLLVANGYHPGTTSKHPGIKPDWYYYGTSQFSSDLQRMGMGAPITPNEELQKAHDALVAARAALRQHETALSRDELNAIFNESE